MRSSLGERKPVYGHRHGGACRITTGGVEPLRMVVIVIDGGRDCDWT